MEIKERIKIVTHEPEWTAENMNKKQGATTFKTCGWCKHASCGSCRYDCHLDTTCSLMKSYDKNNEVKWDTKCKIVDYGDMDIKDIIESKKYEIKDNRHAIKGLEDEIKELKKLKPKKTPPFADSRPHDYYNIGEVVYVYQKDEKEWAKGVVVSGYRHHDGCVSYVLEKYPESKGGWGCGTGVPCILKKWEYEYFKKNKGKLKAWLNAQEKDYNGDKLPVEDYCRAMEEKK